jgi:hypothetical protein
VVQGGDNVLLPAALSGQGVAFDLDQRPLDRLGVSLNQAVIAADERLDAH